MTSKLFTKEEVAQHNQKDSIWIIIDNYVYDVTEWQNEHPGGKRMLQKVAGQDASKKFHKYHDVENVMRKFGIKYRIGALSGALEGANAPESGPVDVSAPESEIKNTPIESETTITPTSASESTPEGIDTPATTSTPDGIDTSTSASESTPDGADSITPASTPDGADADALPECGDLIPFADPMWYQGYNSPYHKPHHAKLRDRIREWVNTNIQPFIDKWEQDQQIPQSVYQQFGKDGWLAYLTTSYFPIEYTPNKHEDILKTSLFDGFCTAIVMDELCRAGSGSIAWFLGGGFGIGIPPVMNFAKAEVKKRVLPGILNGSKRICLCITEPRGGSDVAQLETSAKLTEDKKFYIVNGEKKWITNGLWADYFSVAVRTGPKGMRGISMLLIERSMPGVSVRKIETQGMRCSGSTFVEFDEVKVPVENLIGKENKGFKVIMSNFNHERIGVITQAVRFSRVCFEEAIKYSFARETFGRKLFKHAVIRNKLAQMASRIEAVQASLDFLIYQSQTMDPELASLKLGGQIAGLKAFSTQTFEYVAREASQIFGGLAYTQGGKGGKVERLYRDVRALAIPGGSEEIMLDLAIRQSVKVQQMYGARL